MNPTPRPHDDNVHADQASRYYAPVPMAPDPVEQWLHQREQRSLKQLRSPLVLGAQRIELAAQRCRELQEELDLTRSRLLNAGHVEGSVVLSLEERAMKLAAELHAERLSVWKDLQPLVQQISDASIDALRQH